MCARDTRFLPTHLVAAFAKQLVLVLGEAVHADRFDLVRHLAMHAGAVHAYEHMQTKHHIGRILKPKIRVARKNSAKLVET